MGRSSSFSAAGNITADIFISDEYEAFGFTRLEKNDLKTHNDKVPTPGVDNDIANCQTFERLARKIEVTIVFSEVLQLKV